MRSEVKRWGREWRWIGRRGGWKGAWVRMGLAGQGFAADVGLAQPRVEQQRTMKRDDGARRDRRMG